MHNPLPQSRNIATIVGVLGLATFLFGLGYNMANVLNQNASISLASLVVVGYLLVIAAPLFVRRYYLSMLLAGVAVAFVGWILVSAWTQ